MKKLTTILLLVLVATSAFADVLWDQPYESEEAGGFFNSESGSPPFGSTNYSMADVTVGVDNEWLIDSITTYYSALDQGWGLGITTGYLNVFPKTGPMPTEDPTAGTVVALTSTLVGAHFEVTASGLGVNLAAGDYWIMITPVAPGGFMGPEIHLAAATFWGDSTPTYDVYGFPMPMWAVWNPGADASITINGAVTVGNDEMSFGGVKTMFR